MRSLDIDIRLPNGPRIKMATGFAVRRTVRSIEEMIRLLWQQPQHQHIITDLAKRQRLLPDVYAAYLRGELGQLDTGGVAENSKAQPVIDAWLDEFQVSEAHRNSCRGALKQLFAQVKYAPTLADIPLLLETYRSTCVKDNKPRSFNYAKQASLALIRDTFSRRHPLWEAVADVANMPERKRGATPLSIEKARGVREQLRLLGPLPARTTRGLVEEAAAIWWAMCCTGMGASEYWGEWELLPDRIRIVGTKRPGRRWGSLGREVPGVVSPVRPSMTKDRFAKLLRQVGVTPYQGRHSYATWLEDAEIPRTRRRLYLGHEGKDITDRYEKREITTFLQEDQARLLKLLGPETTLVLSKERGLILIPIAQQA